MTPNCLLMFSACPDSSKDSEGYISVLKWSTIRIGWRNLGRNRKRTLLAVGAIALGQFTLVFVNSMMAGFFLDALETVTGPMVGHVQLHHPDWREERAADLYLDNLAELRASLTALPEVEKASPRIYSAVLAASGEERDEPALADPGIAVGVDIALERERGGLLAELRDDQVPGAGEAALGRILATRLGVRADDLLAVIGQDADGFPVSDLFRVKSVIDSNVELVRSMGIIMSLEDAGELFVLPDQAHEILLYGRDFRDADALKAAVSELPALTETQQLTWREATPEVVRMIDMKNWFDIIFLSIVFVAAAAGIANTAMMSTFERRREFGMLLAVGAQPRRIVGMVLVESVILGIIGVAVGSLAGMALVLLTSYTGINYGALGDSQVDAFAYGDVALSLVIYPRFEIRHITYGLVAVTLTSVLASLWPASLAARLEPMEAMRT